MQPGAVSAARTQTNTQQQQQKMPYLYASSQRLFRRKHKTIIKKNVALSVVQCDKTDSCGCDSIRSRWNVSTTCILFWSAWLHVSACQRIWLDDVCVNVCIRSRARNEWSEPYVLNNRVWFNRFGSRNNSTVVQFSQTYTSMRTAQHN